MFTNDLLNMQRLAGSEEISPIPDVSQVTDSSLTKEIKNSIESSLLKVRFFFFLNIFYGCFLIVDLRYTQFAVI